MTDLWPPRSGAQTEYESLRDAVLSTGLLPDTLVAARFARRGLAGLIAWPQPELEFTASLFGAQRPAWTPHEDPREVALAEGYEFLVSVATCEEARRAVR